VILKSCFKVLSSFPNLSRKLSVANPGRKGKRGGYRYLYLYLQDRRHILLILLDKNEQEDASEEQRKQIREWVALNKKTSGG
jgi:mRNA-degrading endonuclease RelE of RelBE toxin-antitoxin system